ncbi:hypothetical protein KPH14_010603 [Odynerus spinipes]|uniref:MADF domain-containing protein n=1 Tax=Odynerus spinipes TaxID=1348599 RepID=A0AAD9RIK5_9HYME|nr:hypothetical protein KPH14_010603 [Odynerus spinipes]
MPNAGALPSSSLAQHEQTRAYTTTHEAIYSREENWSGPHRWLLTFDKGSQHPFLQVGTGLRGFKDMSSADCGYTHDFLTEFIQLYRALPCLWQVRCKGYKDRLLRNRAYDVLAQKLREVNESADRDTVIRKINTLRTAFRREYKKVLRSQYTVEEPQEQYKPSLWYYDLLKFVTEQNDEELGMKNEESSDENVGLALSTDETTPIQTNIEKIEPPSPVPSRSNTPSNFRPVILQTEGSYGLEYSLPTMMDLPSSKKRKHTAACVRDRCTDTQPAYTDISPKQIVGCPVEEDLKTFGLYVASKLKKSTERQCIIAERIIAEVLLRANFGTLDENTTLTEKSSSHCCLVMSDR